MAEGRKDKDEVKDFLLTIRRMGISFSLLVLFILGEWLISSLVRSTILGSNGEANPGKLGEKAIGWVEEISLVAVGIVWGIHVLTEVVLLVLRHLPFRTSK